MISFKSCDFISPRGALAILLSCAQGTNPLQIYTTRAACAHRRALMISLTDVLIFCARGLPHRPRQHSRSPARSTDGHQHRQRRCHRRRRYLSTVVIPIIAAAVAICIIVAAVVDVILLSPTSEYRHHANLHRRLIDIITGIVGAIIGAVIGRAAAIRIMSFAKQVAVGWVGCFLKVIAPHRLHQKHY